MRVRKHGSVIVVGEVMHTEHSMVPWPCSQKGAKTVVRKSSSVNFVVMERMGVTNCLEVAEYTGMCFDLQG